MKRIVLLLALLLMSQSCFAAETVEKITLRTAINYALENNLDYIKHKLDVEIAKNNIMSANRLQNPQFNALYNFGSTGKGEPNQIGLSETVELGKRGARKNLAKANFALTKENIGYFEYDLKMDVREAYINLVAAKSILDGLSEQQELIEELLDVTKKRVASGKADEMDVIQTEIALNRMIMQVNTAKANVRSAEYEFNKIINPKNNNVIRFDSADDLFTGKGNFAGLLTPDPETKLPSFDSIAENCLKDRFDIRIAKLQIEVAKKNLTVVARQRIPDLEILGGYAYQPKGMSDSGNLRSGAYAGASIVNIPLLYSYKPEIRNAQLEVEKAILNYQSTRYKALRDLNSAYEQFIIAQTNLNCYSENLLKNSDEMIEVAKRNYASGKSNLTTLIVTEQSYKAIIVGYIQALSDYHKCWIDFLREVNTEKFDPEDEAV